MSPIDARKKLEQIRRNKEKAKSGSASVGNVRDLRQLISKKKQNKKSPNNKVASGRVTKNTGGPRDLRETNKKLASRRNLSQSRDNRSGPNKNERPERTPQRPGKISANYKISARTLRVGKQQQQQYYVPPHLQAHQQPTYIIAPAAQPTSSLAMDNVPESRGASILISNLMPSITQSEIIELFGDIGVMTAVNMINQTTALVTYENSSDAVRAVKVYHNRLLDGKPMLVNMMPGSTPASNVRSRVGQAPIVGGNPIAMEVSYNGRHI